MMSLKNKIKIAIELIGIFIFLVCLRDTDSLYSVYILCGLFGLAALLYNTAKKIEILGNNKLKKILYGIATALFATAIILSNYGLWQAEGITEFLYIGACVVFVIIGSISISWNVFKLLDNYINKSEYICKIKIKLSPMKISIVAFTIFAVVYLIFLVGSSLPGNLSPDSISQLSQIIGNQYSNHHPFWHTMIITGCLWIGITIFGKLIAGIIIYSALQILFMAFCFAFCVNTLSHMNVPKVWIVLTTIFFAIMPYHISYSYTMWKDIPFAGAVLIMILALYRIIAGVGNNKVFNYVIYIIGCIGTCLWRSNGWIAFIISFIIFTICFVKKYKKLVIIQAVIIGVTFILINPVLAVLNIEQADTIESLSIPAQQIARVIVDGEELTETEEILLNEIIEVDKIPSQYINECSDRIKDLVRESNNQDFIKNNKLEFIKLYIQLGIKHPLSYLKGWIDETRGYWNGGYEYWIWGEKITENNLGLEKNVVSPILEKLKMKYFEYFKEPIFDIFRSIGLSTWIIAGCGCISLANKKGKRAFLTVPLLAIIATLLIATPVFSEFRYVYASFTCLPFILCITFYKENNEENK